MAERSTKSDAAVAQEELEDAEPGAALAGSAHPAIERLLAHEELASEDLAKSERTRALAPGLHVGVVLEVAGRKAVVSLEGALHDAALGGHVDATFLTEAARAQEPVLLQKAASSGLVIVGVVQGRYPSKLAGDRVEITAAREVTVRSGKSALRLREDGVVDLIGARISASSRGLLRLVGRALRLN